MEAMKSETQGALPCTADPTKMDFNWVSGVPMANFLISGGAGFLGRELTKKAIGNGHSVTVVDDFSTTSEENFNYKSRGE